MYKSGARVSAMTTLRCAQVAVGVSTLVHLHGKGRKDRAIPLWPQTSRVFQDWFRARGAEPGHMALPNARGKPRARHGVTDLLHQAVTKAMPGCPSLQTKQVSPHVIRHYLPFLTMSGHGKKLRVLLGESKVASHEVPLDYTT